jgi:hypothetical protein
MSFVYPSGFCPGDRVKIKEGKEARKYNPGFHLSVGSKATVLFPVDTPPADAVDIHLDGNGVGRVDSWLLKRLRKHNVKEKAGL